MRKTVTVTIITSSLILLFVYTALSKLLSLSPFKTVLSQMPLISSGAAYLAWLVPLSELVLVLLLLYNPTKTWGLYGALLLLSLFTLYILLMTIFNQRLPCSCGGVISTLSWKQHLVFNCVFLALTLRAIHLSSKLSGSPDL